MAKVSQDEQKLMALTRESLSSVLGREPSRQEVNQAHRGFKRMAFTLLDYCDYLARDSMHKVSEIKEKLRKLTKGVKRLSREQLLDRRMKIVESFSKEDLENPVTKKSVEEALSNIDKLLDKQG